LLVRPRPPGFILQWLLWMVLSWLPVGQAAADEPGRAIAVLYPDVGDPYRSVFNTIIEGIEDKALSRVSSFAVGASINTADLQSELKHRDIRAIVALGRQGLKAVMSISPAVSTAAAGVLSVSESDAQNMLVYSLTPDPGLLFAKLKAFMPGARRVIIIYDPKHNAWLVKTAKEAARSLGLELYAKEATDLKTALRLYQEALSAADPRQDVLWLPQDATTVDDNAVLPMVLQEAWDQSLLVFSSNANHVRRGALFSLYPDNRELGRALGAWALSASGGALSPKGVQALRQVLLAVNTRTASHLSISLARFPHRISMVFPEP
jgi:putative tryptophan/tyrosine transport system substrate-binding protein